MTMTQTRLPGGWHEVSREIEARGLSEEDILRALLGALRSVARHADGDPRRQFSGSEAEVLREGGLSLEPRGDGERDARVATMARLAATLAEAKGVREVAQDLGVSATRIRQRAAERSLYGIHEGEEWRFPRWQFNAGANTPIPGLAAVLPSVPAELHPVAVERFFTEPCPDLEIEDVAVSPVTWLESGGNAALVASLAAAL